MKTGALGTAATCLALAVGSATAALATSAATADAATITVNTTTDQLAGGCSLREAIATVDGSGNGNCPAATPGGPNTIVLGAQRYPLTLSDVLIIGPPPTGCISTDDAQLTDDSLGELAVAAGIQNLTIKGAGASQTTIDACKLGDRALEVHAGATVTLEDLTITNAHATDGRGGTPNATDGGVGGNGNDGEDGGAIANEGNLTIRDSAVTDSDAGAGGTGGTGGPAGGSGGDGGAGGHGGGIYNASGATLTLTDSTISGNSAGDGGTGGAGTPTDDTDTNGGDGGPAGNGGSGGGIWNQGTLTVTGTTIAANRTGAGATGGSGQNASSESGNGGSGGAGGASGNAGGIGSEAGVVAATNDTIDVNLIPKGGQGGPAGAGGDDLDADGIGGNGGDGGVGGGLWNKAGNADLLNVTMAGNQAGDGGAGGAAVPGNDGAGPAGDDGVGGGLYMVGGSPTTLQDTILNQNEPGGECNGTIIDGGGNLVYQPAGPPPSGACDTSGFVSGDPDLQALADNGGPTQTMRLGPVSAALGKGEGCAATDQRGVTRPAGCDVGSYQVAPPTVVTGAATGIGQTSATLNGTVTANQVTASFYFELGSTKTAMQNDAGVSPVAAAQTLTGLTPGTTYHYELVATSIDGTTTGSEKTFTTASSKPKPKPPAITKLKVKHGKVTYSDSETATTSFMLSLCTKHGCHRKRTFSHHDRKGKNSLKLKGLKHGRYKLSASPKADGIRGRTVTVKFKH